MPRTPSRSSRFFSNASGHNAEQAEKLHCLPWYASLGKVLFTVAVMAAAGTYSITRAMHETRETSLVAAALVAVIVFNIDKIIGMSPLTSDRWNHRAAFLLVRGTLSLGLSLYIAYGLLLTGFSSSLHAIAARDAALAATNDGNNIRDHNKKLQDTIDTENAKVTTLRQANAKLEKQSTTKWAAWKEDMLPCATGKMHAQHLTCQGDEPGAGNISNPLKHEAQQFDATILKPQEKANNATIKSLQIEIATNQASLNSLVSGVQNADKQATGLAAQSKALWTLLHQNPFLLLLPLAIIGLDMSVALIRALFPATGWDRYERSRRAEEDRREAAKATDPSWVQARAEMNRLDAEAAIREHRERIEKHLSGLFLTPQPTRGPNTRRGLWPVAVIGTVLVLLAATLTGIALTHYDHHHAQAVASSTTSSSGTVPVTKPITVHVSPGSSTRVTVPGVGTLTAPKGAFSTAGTMTVTADRATPPASDKVTVTNPGVDATFTGTKLVKPVTLTFTGQRPSSGAMPVVAHRGDNGTWNYLPATVNPDGTVTGSTEQFSLNVLGWVSDVLQWVKDAAQAVGDALAHALAGRTSPLTCSGAPAWFQYQVQHSDLVHVCAKDAGPDGNGVDRAEIQIKSNRGVSEEVTIPGSPNYVWVSDQSWNERRWAMARIGRDPNRTVVLSAGSTMTVGYTRPPADETFSFYVDPVTWLAVSDTVLRQALTTISEYTPPSVWFLYTEGACATGAQPTMSGIATSTTFGNLLTCMFNQVLPKAAKTSDAIAAALGDGPAVAQSLAAVAKRLPDVAALVQLIPYLQLGVGNDIDEIHSLITGGQSNQVTFSMAGPPATTLNRPGSDGDPIYLIPTPVGSACWAA